MMFSFIEVLRALAVTLITNSHFDGVYPIDISWGGVPGVSLFFMITGFLIGKLDIPVGFGRWYTKKIIRLWIPLTIVNIIIVAIGFRKASAGLFLFPIHTLWYVPAIAVLYIFFYFLQKYLWNYRKQLIVAIVATYGVVYIFCYDKSIFFVELVIWFRLMYGFIAMILGSMIRDAVDEGNVCSHSNLLLFAAVLCIIGFLGTKLLLNKAAIFMKLQFITQIFSVAFAWFVMRAAAVYEAAANRFLKTKIGLVVEWISKASLEIYLVQFAIIAYLRELNFPVNFILICLTIIAFATAIHYVAELLTRKILVYLKF